MSTTCCSPSTAESLKVADAIRQRRSVKNFQSKPIPPEKLEELVELTLAAPSSWNFQPWRLILVQSPEQKAALSKVAWNQRQIVDAPVTFVFAVSVRGWEKTMEQTLETASSQGAWPPPFVDFIRKNAPGFQKGLGDKEREYAIKDAMIAATHAVLAAESMGLGTCLMNGWDEKGVKTVLGAGDDPDIAIALVLPVGYPQERPKSPGRLPRAVTVFSERIA